MKMIYSNSKWIPIMVFSLNIVTLVLRLHMFLYPGEVRSHPGVVARLAVVATPLPGTYHP